MNTKALFSKEKLQQFEQFLDKKRYQKRSTDFTMQYCDGKEFNAGALKPIAINDRWGGYGNYVWLVIDADLPKDFVNSEGIFMGYFDLGVTGPGHNTGFEGLCYVDGEICQAIDQNHQEIMLPHKKEQFQVKMLLWAGLEASGKEREIRIFHEIKEASFRILHKDLDDLYHFVRAINQTVGILNENDYHYQRLIHLLDRVYQQVDLTSDNDIYLKSKELVNLLETELAAMRDDNPVTIRCLGHTHIDVAWLWRLQHTREKSLRSFSTVLRLMELYPQYVFFQSQPQLYQYIKEDAPALFEKIKERVAEGRWEANGGMWVEADCNLTSGESLVRQLLYGQEFFAQEFNKKSNCLWLPDVFGYSAALPQILRKSDIDNFMTTKISWNQYNRIPNDTFMWKGIDGSEVLTHFITTPTAPRSGGWFSTYNGMIAGYSIKGIWDGYLNKELTNELLLAYGHGDGGGGVTREMLEMVDKLDKIPTNPKVITGTASEYFDTLHETITDKKVNSWQGELYLEFHRGTYTSQAKTKKYNRKLEYLLRNSEILFSTVIDSKLYPLQELLLEWRKVLTNQFHDILPGSSISDVYEDAMITYAEVESNVKTLLEKLVYTQRKESANTWTIFNPSGFQRKELVFIESDKNFIFKTASGDLVPSQKVATGYDLLISLEPLETVAIYAMENVSSTTDKNLESFSLTSGFDNKYYRINWNENGQIVSLFDKELGKELVAENQLANELRMYEDLPRMFDAWELEPYYRDKFDVVDNLQSVRMIERGELVTVIEFIWTYQKSTIKQLMKLYNHTKRIDFTNDVDWHEEHKILRVEFPLNVHATKAHFDIQYGNVERDTHSNTLWEFAQFEVVGHKWASMAQRDLGLALMNDCKYGYRAKDGVLSLSLLKASKDPDSLADQGKQNFSYAILPFAGDWYQGNVEQEADLLNNEAWVMEGLLEPQWRCHFSEENIVLDAIKLAQDGDGYIIRMHEYSGQSKITTISLSKAMTQWCETNLMERNISNWSSDAITLEFKPYEVKTIRIKL